MPTVLDVTERSIVPLGRGSIDRTVVATGVAAAGAFGTAKLNATVKPQGEQTVGAVGVPATVAQLAPSGFADAGAAGTPSLVKVMGPPGVGSGEAFGTVIANATAFIIPGPVDPSNDFGDATVTRQGWVFRPPVNTYKWRLFKEYEGISLLKENGTWSEVAHPDLPRTKAAEKYLAGGRDHVVGDALKAELVALGYTVTQEVVTTEEFL